MSITRRVVLHESAALALASGLSPVLMGGADAAGTKQKNVPHTMLLWLDGAAPKYLSGCTFGIPWPRGVLAKDQAFHFAGSDLAVQSWPLATWPDGSLKWSAHAVNGDAAGMRLARLEPGAAKAPVHPVSVVESPEGYVVQTGDRRWVVPKKGKSLIAEASVAGKVVLKSVGLTARVQNHATLDEAAEVFMSAFTGVVEKAVVEQSGPVRAVIKLDGHHFGSGVRARSWLPFSIRLYFYAGTEAVRMVHSFIYDGDPAKDFITGLGLTANVPMHDAPYDRHIRFTGPQGVWGEAVRPVTGLRRDPGKAFRDAQIAGRALPPLSGMDPRVSGVMERIPAWGDFSLSQPNADGFVIRKRTGPGNTWIDAISGHRASGLAYAGGASGGVAIGMGDFWQRAPTRLDVRGATGDTAELTAWLYSPDGAAMDLRPFHGTMGMDTFEKQNEGLNITYEDYQPGWDTPYGIARTSELMLWTLPATPSHSVLSDMSATLAKPPHLMVSPKRLHDANVFGEWSLPDSSTPARAAIEKRYSYLLDFYLRQVEDRHWYGFWNYGDIMHTYDVDRHTWRYDIGGFAWDNSELSSDLLFWYGFLRTGRADVFRMAEAMTRHTGEVDVYHLGKWAGFGTRHGVLHYADSSKQPRISNGAYRRFYFYLTGDERCADLIHELIHSDEVLPVVKINRKLTAGREGVLPGAQESHVSCSFGTMWGSFLGAWLTEWERTGDTKWRDRILTGMRTIGGYKRGWFAGGGPYDLKTGAFLGEGDYIAVSHLNCVFGVVEMTYELLDLLDVPEYRKAWLEYCTYYNAPNDVIRAYLGEVPKGRSLRCGHSRLTAWAARESHDKALARRAWKEFYEGDDPHPRPLTPTPAVVKGPDVLQPMEEDVSVSTNGAAQWCLAAIQNLALIGDPPAE